LVINHNQDVQVRIAVRSADKTEFIKSLENEQTKIDVSFIDISEPKTLDEALVGIDKIFILPPFSEELLQVNNAWVDAAKRAKTSFILKCGEFESQKRSNRMEEWHDEAEKYLQASGLNYCFVRSFFLMSNIASQTPSIKKTGKFFQSFGNGSIAYLDPRDLADVISKILASRSTSEYFGKTISVIGEEALNCAQIAQIFSKILNRTVNYVEMTENNAYEGMRSSGTSEIIAKSLVDLSRLFKSGFGNQPANVIFDQLGRHASPFEQYLQQQNPSQKSHSKRLQPKQPLTRPASTRFIVAPGKTTS